MAPLFGTSRLTTTATQMIKGDGNFFGFDLVTDSDLVTDLVTDAIGFYYSLLVSVICLPPLITGELTNALGLMTRARWGMSVDLIFS